MSEQSTSRPDPTKRPGAQGESQQETWDFFVSRAGPDAAFSSEIARILAADGLRVLVQEQDFANHSFMERMHAGLKSGARVIALLSPDYLTREHCEAEWQGAIAEDPLNRNRRLIIMRVRESKPEGLLSTFPYWDLVPLRDSPDVFRDIVLAAVRNETPPAAAPYRRAPETLLHNEIRALPAFTGRIDNLARIHAMLGSPSNAAATKIVAVQGVPGVGKSMLVKKYAWEHRDQYAGVWWLSAETESLILDGLIGFGATFFRDLDQVKDRHQAAHQALRFIDSGGFDKPWLLIFDNVEKPDTIARLTPRSGAHVLVTTRWADWYGQAVELLVDVFPQDVAIAFLLNRAQRDDRDGALRLAADLGHLPLALEHAGSYCRGTQMTFDNYRAALAELIKRKPRDGAYPDSVFATFNLAIEKASASAPEAETLMGLLAYFAPDHVPLGLITTDVMSDIARGEAVAALAEVSLITLVPPFKAGAPSVNVHRLVQQTMRGRLAESGGEPTASVTARKLVADAVQALPFSRDDVRSWPDFGRLLPHALATIYAPDSAEGADAKNFLLHEIGTYHDARAEHDKAEAFLRYALASVFADRGWTNPHLAAGMRNLAGHLKRVNKLDEAEKYARRALDIDLAVLGPDHPELVGSLKTLASVLCATRQYGEAEPLIQRALSIQETALPANQPDIADSLRILATLLNATDRRDEAEPLLRRALAIDEAVFGPDHPNVATNLSDLAALLYATRRMQEAEPLYRRALAIDDATLGPNHPNVARELNNLGTLLHATDRLDEAESLYRRAFEIEEAIFGPDHPNVATASNNLARLLQAAQRYEEAETLLKRAIDIQQRALPANHPDAASTLIGLGELLYATNRPEEAEPLLRRALPMVETAYGSDHPNVSIMLNKLAALLVAMHRPDEAERLFRRAVAINEASLGADHQSLPDILGNLAGLLSDAKRFEEAEPLYRRALNIAEAAYPPNHPIIAISLNNLALLLRDTGHQDQAEPLFRRSLALKEANCGPDHPELAIGLNNLAKLLFTTSRSEEAEPLYRRALGIAEQRLGPAHAVTERVRTNLAELLATKGVSTTSQPPMRQPKIGFWSRLFSRR